MKLKIPWRQRTGIFVRNNKKSNELIERTKEESQFKKLVNALKGILGYRLLLDIRESKDLLYRISKWEEAVILNYYRVV